jgi:hypothetical protein
LRHGTPLFFKQGLAVRRCRWLVVAVFFLPLLANEATVAPGAPGQALAIEDVSGPWRRTREGWQRVELFGPQIPYRRPALHPAVVGSLELLLTMTAMLALSRKRGDFSLSTKICTKSSLRRH